MTTYPKVLDESMVGEYSALVPSGGGYVWDEVLEYRVWCHPENGAEDLDNGSDYYYPYANYDDAETASKSLKGAEEPLALILQREYIDEPEDGKFKHIKAERITEWQIKLLTRPKRNKDTIPNFMSPLAPANKLDILRGVA